tara:strand:- start:937 stop:1515 length:579 start_codon:yes stop_codon:yes gene_type:complete
MDERLNDIESSELSCSICLNDKIDNEILCNTNCNHSFCKECLQDWFHQGKNTCPICRQVLQSYMVQEQKTQLITIESRRTPTIDNVLINGQSARDIIRTLINSNIKLRYMMYMFGLSGILMLSFYLGLKNNYEELLLNYHQCRNNYTELYRENIDIHNMLNDHKIVGIVYDSNHYKLCTIPELYYNSCFENL